MNPDKENNNGEEWALHPLFLSKIPTEQEINKHAALSALISIINEEEEQETFSYEPKRKNLKKKITSRGEVIHKKDRRNLYEPYQNMTTRNMGLKKSRGGRLLYSNNYMSSTTNVGREMGKMWEDGFNTNVNTENENNNDGNNNSNNSNDINNNDDDADAKSKKAADASVGELIVCMSMLNLN